MDNLKITEYGDLIIYKESGAIFLAEVIGIDSNRFISIKDHYVLRNTKEQFLPQSIYGIGESDIFVNYGKITLQEFRERYPEWLI